MTSRFKSTMIFLAIAILVWVIQLIGRSYPTVVDLLYTRGLFQAIRVLFDFTFGWLPVANVYILFAFLIFLIIRFIIWIKKKKLSRIDGLWIIIRFLAISYTLFYLLWGFNYNQSSVEKLMHLSNLKMTSSDLQKEYMQASNDLNLIMQEASLQGWNIDTLLNKSGREREIRKHLEDVLASFDYPTNGRVRGRLLRPKGTLLVFNTAGIYIPYVGEGHVDNGLLSFQKPFVMAHEMSHAYGITDEGSCNFLGYLTCLRADDLFVRFSGIFGYWRYVASEFRMQDEGSYLEAFKELPPQAEDCLRAIYQNNEKYPELMPKMRYKIYDEYLKAQGIQEGNRNYSRVVKLFAYYRT